MNKKYKEIIEKAVDKIVNERIDPWSARDMYKVYYTPEGSLDAERMDVCEHCVDDIGSRDDVLEILDIDRLEGYDAEDSTCDACGYHQSEEGDSEEGEDSDDSFDDEKEVMNREGSAEELEKIGALELSKAESVENKK